MLRSSAKQSNIQTVSRAFLGGEQIAIKAGPIQFVRGKRIKRSSDIHPLKQRIITQLSVISARKKIPRVLKLSDEDLVRHDTVTRAWGVYQKDKRTAQESDLEQQYQSLKETMKDLKLANTELYTLANIRDNGRRFPIDYRIPTDYPPNKVWYYEFTPKKDEPANK